MKPEYKLLDDEWQFWRLDPAELAAAWYHEIKRELTRYQNDIEDYPKCDIDPPWLDLSDDDPLKILKLDSTKPDPLSIWPDWMAFPEKWFFDNSSGIKLSRDSEFAGYKVKHSGHVYG